MVALGVALRDARKSVGLTVAELGKRLGISHQAIYAAENGRSVGLQHAWAVAAALEIPLADIVESAEDHERGP